MKYVHLVIEVNEFGAINNLQSPVDKYIVTTSKLPAESTLYTKGMLFAKVQIVAIKALGW